MYIPIKTEHYFTFCNRLHLVACTHFAVVLYMYCKSIQYTKIPGIQVCRYTILLPIGCTYSVLSFCKPAKIIINNRERAGDPAIVHQRVTVFVKYPVQKTDRNRLQQQQVATQWVRYQKLLNLIVLFFVAHFLQFYLCVKEGGS